MKKGIRSRPSALQIAMLALAVLILLEGLFLLHLKSAAAEQGAAAPEAQSTAQAAASGDGNAQESASGAESSDAPDASAPPEETPAGSEGENASASGSGSAQAPVQTPKVTIPPENKGKPYAGAIAALSNYAKSPSAGTLAYLLGGEALGEQMQRFLPALITMSGSSADMMIDEMNTVLALPEGTTSLTITDAQPLPAEEIDSAREQVRAIETSYAAMAEGFSDTASFSDDDWAAIGRQLGLSGSQAKRLLNELADSSRAMAGLLSGADVTEGYLVSLKTNTGAAAQTSVYCIGGKWVTSAFFNMEFN